MMAIGLGLIIALVVFVGVLVLIRQDRTGYGIHGTPSPEQFGRTESHGCFRLANRDAEYLSQLAWVEMQVFVEP
jgi:lipoprotein-anchoring transpeptidase ErfK/SrfK